MILIAYLRALQVSRSDARVVAWIVGTHKAEPAKEMKKRILKIMKAMKQQPGA